MEKSSLNFQGNASKWVRTNDDSCFWDAILDFLLDQSADVGTHLIDAIQILSTIWRDFLAIKPYRTQHSIARCVWPDVETGILIIDFQGMRKHMDKAISASCKIMKCRD